MRLKPKSDTGFIQKAETPVSVGLPLTVYRKVHDKSLVNLLSDMYFGSYYDTVINLQKRENEGDGWLCSVSLCKKGEIHIFHY